MKLLVALLYLKKYGKISSIDKSYFFACDIKLVTSENGSWKFYYDRRTLVSFL